MKPKTPIRLGYQLPHEIELHRARFPFRAIAKTHERHPEGDNICKKFVQIFVYGFLMKLESVRTYLLSST